jgi:hypothetical protein
LFWGLFPCLKRNPSSHPTKKDSLIALSLSVCKTHKKRKEKQNNKQPVVSVLVQCLPDLIFFLLLHVVDKGCHVLDLFAPKQGVRKQ